MNHITIDNNKTKIPDEIVEKRKSLMGALRGQIKIIGNINEPLTKEELSEWYDEKTVW